MRAFFAGCISFIILLSVFLVGVPYLGISVFADDDITLKYYLGETAVNTGKNNGYSEMNTIEQGDVHYGWSLGRFVVDGYTRAVENDNGDVVFLKNVGDTVSLSFELEHDINILNNDKSLSIAEDNDGFDSFFGLEKTDFGNGVLLIRKTDYQNSVSDPDIFENYLFGKQVGAETHIELFEEGDYEIALNYKVRSAPIDIFGLDILPSYTDYRIYFKFSVRNGNSMVYPFDVVTGEELTNTSITENGFYLDMAKSRYLIIDIKKEILQEGADGLTEDIRFNRPAKDGDIYTDEGIYTFTVTNQYTGQETVKKIYVGADDILRAHIVTGLTVTDIKSELENGAFIKADGTIEFPAEDLSEIDDATVSAPQHSAEPSSTAVEMADESALIEPDVLMATSLTNELNSFFNSSLGLAISGVIAILLLIIVLLILVIKRKQKKLKAYESVRNNVDVNENVEV